MKDKIIIGLWPLSGDFGKIDIYDFEKTLDFCLASGLNVFDLAPNYGNGFIEDSIGEVYEGKVPMVINTKFGNNRSGKKDFSVSSLRKSLETSLTKLKLDKVNTLFLHNPRDEISDYGPIENLMSDLKKEKLIKFSGLSVAKGFNYNYLPNFDSIQFDCNLLFLEDLFKYQNIFSTSYVRSPLASGILSGKLTRKSIFSKEDHRSEWICGERLSSFLDQVEAIENLSENLSLPSLARKFLFQNKGVDKIIFGVKSPRHVEDIVNDYKSLEISQTLINKLIELERNDFGLERILRF